MSDVREVFTAGFIHGALRNVDDTIAANIRPLFDEEGNATNKLLVRLPPFGTWFKVTVELESE